jgi:hypothetical protein
MAPRLDQWSLRLSVNNRKDPSFKVGEAYTNDQLSFPLNVENLGGMRPALYASKNL